MLKPWQRYVIIACGIGIAFLLIGGLPAARRPPHAARRDRADRRPGAGDRLGRPGEPPLPLSGSSTGRRGSVTGGGPSVAHMSRAAGPGRTGGGRAGGPRAGAPAAGADGLAARGRRPLLDPRPGLGAGRGPGRTRWGRRSAAAARAVLPPGYARRARVDTPGGAACGCGWSSRGWCRSGPRRGEVTAAVRRRRDAVIAAPTAARRRSSCWRWCPWCCSPACWRGSWWRCWRPGSRPRRRSAPGPCAPAPAPEARPPSPRPWRCRASCPGVRGLRFTARAAVRTP